ncbi:MAG: zinc ribbon domain-containing protein [Canidatus Methanoxibalbensis ujae]|nr:zinc ribbon domain-containing protein [Candidatus Methanoxibalbensis ujae]
MVNGLHKIAKNREAEKHNAAIAIGDLKGIRNNRKVNSMPSHKLKEYIKYKALEQGILVMEVPEYNTSKQCSRCGSMNTERHKDYSSARIAATINADVNGAKNKNEPAWCGQGLL